MTHWPIILPARTTGQHTLVYNADRLTYLLRHTKPCDVNLVLERLHATRSPRANAYYWGVCVEAVADYTGHTKDEIHAYAKQRFLPKRIDFVHKSSGLVVEEVTLGRSTTTLTTPEFHAYVHDFKRWAWEDLGVWIPEPDLAV